MNTCGDNNNMDDQGNNASFSVPAIPLVGTDVLDSDDAMETPVAREYFCRIIGCNAKFKTSSNQKRHERQHCGEKPFQCNICSRKFARKYDLQVHERIHTKEKPYHCAITSCGKRFTRSSSLREHERNIHSVYAQKTPKIKKSVVMHKLSTQKKKSAVKKVRLFEEELPLTPEMKEQVRYLVSSFQAANQTRGNPEAPQLVPFSLNVFTPSLDFCREDIDRTIHSLWQDWFCYSEQSV